MKILKVIPVVALLFLSANAHAQIFGWADDGYIDGSGGGTYNNIDNSGISLTISGLYNDNSAANNSVKTGINNQAANGLIHTYSFSFSEMVDVAVEIENINLDTTNSSCYDDLLVFDNSPLILNAFPWGAITVSNDSVIPLNSLEGEIEVRYSNITSFTVTHGRGVSCNPGFIRIRKLVINDNVLNVNDLFSSQKVFIYNDLKNEMSIDIANSTDVDFELFDAMGRKYNPSFTMNSGELKISTENLNVGNYFIRVVLDDQEIFQSHFFKS